MRRLLVRVTPAKFQNNRMQMSRRKQHFARFAFKVTKRGLACLAVCGKTCNIPRYCLIKSVQAMLTQVQANEDPTRHLLPDQFIYERMKNCKTSTFILCRPLFPLKVS